MNYFTPRVTPLTSIRVKPEIFYPSFTPSEFKDYWETGTPPAAFEDVWVPLTPPTFGELSI